MYFVEHILSYNITILSKIKWLLKIYKIKDLIRHKIEENLDAQKRRKLQILAINQWKISHNWFSGLTYNNENDQGVLRSLRNKSFKSYASD